MPEELMEDALLAEMDAELEAAARRVSDAGLEKANGKEAVETAKETGESAKDAGKSRPPQTDGREGGDSNDLPRFAPLVWEDASDIEVGRVQQFWPTAPPYPGGQARQWYTNSQTEAFCGMLGIQNKVNPRPVER